jgi:hypothetical protein
MLMGRQRHRYTYAFIIDLALVGIVFVVCFSSHVWALVNGATKNDLYPVHARTANSSDKTSSGFVLCKLICVFECLYRFMLIEIQSC